MNRARAVADVTSGSILASVEIAAPIERVFRAISTDELTKWWASADMYRTTGFTADLRVGGRWRATGVGADGHEFSVEGEIREIDPPRKLVQTWVAAWDGGNETVITYRLESIDGGTRVTVRHECFGDRMESCRSHGDGWKHVLDWLRDYFAGEHKYFLVRLLPPRPTFAMDMTAEEKAMMERHAAYWTGLLKREIALFFGPVLDPSGPWGVGIVRAKDAKEVEGLRDEDPAITSGRGLRYEILPMMRAVF